MWREAPGQPEKQELQPETCWTRRISFFALCVLCHPQHRHPQGASSVLTALSRASSGAGGELGSLAGTLGTAQHGERGVCSKAQTSEHHSAAPYLKQSFRWREVGGGFPNPQAVLVGKLNFCAGKQSMFSQSRRKERGLGIARQALPGFSIISLFEV